MLLYIDEGIDYIDITGSTRPDTVRNRVAGTKSGRTTSHERRATVRALVAATSAERTMGDGPAETLDLAAVMRTSVAVGTITTGAARDRDRIERAQV